MLTELSMDAILSQPCRRTCMDPMTIMNFRTLTFRRLCQDLAALIAQVVGFEGKIVYDIDKPDGTPRKLMDVSKINALGWSANIPLETGIEMVYQNVKDKF